MSESESSLSMYRKSVSIYASRCSGLKVTFSFYQMAAILDFFVKIMSASNKCQNRNPRGRITQTSVSIRDCWRFGSKVNFFFEMMPAAILDLALWRKMPAFLEGPGG